jgi:hypothetical protein
MTSTFQFDASKILTSCIFLLIVGFSILMRVYSQSQIKLSNATQYSVFTLSYIKSSDCLLYIIVITPEDGHHEGPKHVV